MTPPNAACSYGHQSARVPSTNARQQPATARVVTPSSSCLTGAATRSAPCHKVPASPGLRIPSVDEIKQLLLNDPDCTARKLCLALDLPAHALLSRSAPENPLLLLQHLLRAACPLSMTTLAQDLHKYVGVPAVAASVRQMALQQGLETLQADNGPALDALTRRLAPLENKAKLLSEALRVFDRFEAIKKALAQELDQQACLCLIEQACLAAPRNCIDWLAVLARVPLAESRLQQIACQWSLPCPVMPPASPPGPSHVPSVTAVTEALVQCNFASPLKLGVMLDLPADFLLSLASWSDPLLPLKKTLQAACPFNMEQLAQYMEDDYLAQPDLATRLRVLAEHDGLDQISADMTSVLDKLAHTMAPLAGMAHLLGEQLRLNTDQIAAIQLACSYPDRLRSDDTLWAVIHEASRQRQRSREDWLTLVSCVTNNTLCESLARKWQLAPPDAAIHRHDWYRSMRPDRNLLHQALVRQQTLAPARPVPLSQAWWLMQPFHHRPFFGLALEDPVAPQWNLRTKNDGELAALISLLRHAAGQESGQVSGSQLQKMVHFHCAGDELACQLPALVLAPERVSRRLRPSDLLALVLGRREPESGQCWPCEQEALTRQQMEREREAMEVAATLGVGEHYLMLTSSSRRKSPAERALSIWRRVYNALPLLETGHLVQVFRRFDKPELVDRLTGDPDSDIQPTVPLRGLSCRAAAFVDLACELRQLPPGTVEDMAPLCDLSDGIYYQAPPGTDPLYRLLNHIIWSERQALKSLYALLDQTLTAQTGRAQTPEATTRAQQALANIQAEVHDAYLCPISLDYMDDPVARRMTIDQNREVIRHFSKAHLLRWLQQDPRHPLTREPLLPATVDAMNVDLVHRARIQNWRQRHPELEDGALLPSSTGEEPGQSGSMQNRV